MAEIMTTMEVAKYLKLHEITICKNAKEGKISTAQKVRFEHDYQGHSH